MLPVVSGPPCERCEAPLRLILDRDLVLARCVTCRHMRIYAPQESPWAAFRQRTASA